MTAPDAAGALTEALRAWFGEPAGPG